MLFSSFLMGIVPIKRTNFLVKKMVLVPFFQTHPNHDNHVHPQKKSNRGVVGLIPMTSGEAMVCGYDVRTELESVRRNISVCPQDEKRMVCYIPLGADV
jgi:hypothetical protein